MYHPALATQQRTCQHMAAQHKPSNAIKNQPRHLKPSAVKQQRHHASTRTPGRNRWQQKTGLPEHPELQAIETIVQLACTPSHSWRQAMATGPDARRVHTLQQATHNTDNTRHQKNALELQRSLDTLRNGTLLGPAVTADQGRSWPPFTPPTSSPWLPSPHTYTPTPSQTLPASNKQQKLPPIPPSEVLSLLDALSVLECYDTQLLPRIEQLLGPNLPTLPLDKLSTLLASWQHLGYRVSDTTRGALLEASALAMASAMRAAAAGRAAAAAAAGGREVAAAPEVRAAAAAATAGGRQVAAAAPSARPAASASAGGREAAAAAPSARAAAAPSSAVAAPQPLPHTPPPPLPPKALATTAAQAGGLQGDTPAGRHVANDRQHKPRSKASTTPAHSSSHATPAHPPRHTSAESQTAQRVTPQVHKGDGTAATQPTNAGAPTATSQPPPLPPAPGPPPFCAQALQLVPGLAYQGVDMRSSALGACWTAAFELSTLPGVESVENVELLARSASALADMGASPSHTWLSAFGQRTAAALQEGPQGPRGPSSDELRAAWDGRGGDGGREDRGSRGGDGRREDRGSRGTQDSLLSGSGQRTSPAPAPPSLRALVQLVTAAARLGCPIRDPALCTLPGAWAGPATLSTLPPHLLADLAWSLASLGAAPGQDWSDAFLTASHAAMPCLQPTQAVRCLHAAVLLRAKPYRLWLKELELRLLYAAPAGAMAAGDAVVLVECLRRIRRRPDMQTSSRLVGELSRLLPDMDAGQMSAVLDALRAIYPTMRDRRMRQLVADLDFRLKCGAVPHL